MSEKCIEKVLKLKRTYLLGVSLHSRTRGNILMWNLGAMENIDGYFGKEKNGSKLQSDRKKYYKLQKTISTMLTQERRADVKDSKKSDKS